MYCTQQRVMTYAISSVLEQAKHHVQAIGSWLWGVGISLFNKEKKCLSTLKLSNTNTSVF